MHFKMQHANENLFNVPSPVRWFFPVPLPGKVKARCKSVRLRETVRIHPHIRILSEPVLKGFSFRDSLLLTHGVLLGFQGRGRCPAPKSAFLKPPGAQTNGEKIGSPASGLPQFSPHLFSSMGGYAPPGKGGFPPRVRKNPGGRHALYGRRNEHHE